MIARARHRTNKGTTNMITFASLPFKLKAAVLVYGLVAGGLLMSLVSVKSFDSPTATAAPQQQQQAAVEELDEFGYPSKTRKLPIAEENYVIACLDRWQLAPDHLLKYSPELWREAFAQGITKCRRMYRDFDGRMPRYRP